MRPSYGQHADLGLQPERTWLAWRRTLVSLVAASLFFLRWVPHHGRFAYLMVGLALAAALAIGVGQQRRYQRSVQAMHLGRGQAPWAEVLALALACTALGALGIYAVLTL